MIKKMATKTFQIWESPDGTTMIEKGNPQFHLLFEPEDLEQNRVNLLHEFQATTWNEACQKRNDFLGFGEYHPMSDPKFGLPFPEDSTEFQD